METVSGAAAVSVSAQAPAPVPAQAPFQVPAPVPVQAPVPVPVPEVQPGGRTLRAGSLLSEFIIQSWGESVVVATTYTITKREQLVQLKFLST